MTSLLLKMWMFGEKKMLVENLKEHLEIIKKVYFRKNRLSEGIIYGYEKAIEDVKNYNPWIPASNPPKNTNTVLICLSDGKEEVQRTGWYESYYGMWFLDGYGGDHVSEKIIKGWQPLSVGCEGRNK